MKRLFLLAAIVSASPAAAQPAHAPDPVLVGMLERLRFTGTAQERACFVHMAARLLESPTARELAAVLAAQSGTAAVSFFDSPTTEIYEKSPGVTSFAGQGAAHAVRNADGAEVVLNRSCLVIDRATADVVCPEQLAHELFGHTLGWFEASPAVRRSYWLYDDELLARLVGWNVKLELGGRLIDPEAYCAAEDPAAFQRHLPSVYPSCMEGLTREELRDAEPSLREHLKRAADERTRAVIAGELRFFEGEAGRENREAARTAAGDPLFDRLEARAQALRARLLASPDVVRLPALCADYR